MTAPPIFIISGPTATGKTQLALELARKLKSLFDRTAEIVNFDSLLFYHELKIGTAKPSHEELQSITHHMIDITSITNPLNASDYADQAKKIIMRLQESDKIPILVGGSGFYLRALIKGMIESPQKSKSIVEAARKVYQTQGIEPIIDYLRLHDPESLRELHLNDHYRLMRSYEYHQQTGIAFSKQKELIKQNRPYDFSSHQFGETKLYHIYLNIPPAEHWSIIEKRTQSMIEKGLIDEVKTLLNLGFSSSCKPLESIGYKETIAYLNHHHPNQANLIESINIATRQLAKSQRTFFQKIQPKLEYHPLRDQDKIIRDLQAWWSTGEDCGS